MTFDSSTTMYLYLIRLMVDRRAPHEEIKYVLEIFQVGHHDEKTKIA
jgi:hypothetical protein